MSTEVANLYMSLTANIGPFEEALAHARALAAEFETTHIQAPIISAPSAAMQDTGAAHGELGAAASAEEQAVAGATLATREHFTATDAAAQESEATVGTHLKATGSSFTQFAGVAGMLKPLAGLAIAGFAVESIGHFDEVGHAAYEMSEKFGLLPAQASQWVVAGQAVGVSADSMSTGMKLMARQMEAAHIAFDAGKQIPAQLAEPLKDLGVSLLDSSGHMRDMNSVLMDAANAFQQMPDGPQKAADAMKLFGRSGADLIPVLNQGADGLHTLMQQAVDSGAALSGPQVESAQQAYLAHKKLDETLTGLSNTLGSVLAPVLMDLVPPLQWLADHMDQLQPIIIGVGAAFVALKVQAAISGVIGAVTGAVKGLTAAFDFLAANPIILVVAAIALAVYELYEHWDQVKEILYKVGDFLGSLGGDVQQVWNSVTDFVGGVIQRVVGLVGSFIDIYTTIPRKILAAIGDVGSTLLSAGRNLIGGLWNGMVDGINHVMDFWSNLGASIFNAILSGLHYIYDIGKNIVHALGDGITDAAGWLADRIGSIPVLGGLAGGIGNLIPHAAGGPFSAGDHMLVGEQGPELVSFGTGGNVMPTGQTRTLFSNGMGAVPGGGASASGGVTINGVTINVDGSKSPTETAMAVRDALLNLTRSGVNTSWSRAGALT